MRAYVLASVVVFAAACGGSSDSDGSGGTGGSGGSGTGGSGGSGTGGSAGSGTGGSAGSGTGGSAGSGAGGSAGSGTGGSAGSAGAGATGGSAGSAGSAGAGGSAGADCAGLGDKMQKALAEAQQCSPNLTVIQCDGSATSYDMCGCEVVLNETQSAKVKAAQDAYKAWVDAGCGPFGCGAPCFIGTKGACDPASSKCQWASG